MNGTTNLNNISLYFLERAQRDFNLRLKFGHG